MALKQNKINLDFSIQRNLSKQKTTSGTIQGTIHCIIYRVCRDTVLQEGISNCKRPSYQRQLARRDSDQDANSNQGIRLEDEESKWRSLRGSDGWGRLAVGASLPPDSGGKLLRDRNDPKAFNLKETKIRVRSIGRIRNLFWDFFGEIVLCGACIWMALERTPAYLAGCLT